MAKTKKSENKTAAPDQSASQVTTENTEQKRKVTFVVVREGFRVSDKEYENPEDPLAISEKDFWTKVAKNHSWGEPVEIVQYDSKQHRVW